MEKKMMKPILRFWKFPLGIRMLVLLMLVGQIAFSAGNAVAQKSITIRFTNSSLSDILGTLKQKSGYEFLYNDEEIKNIGAISKDFTDATVEDILTGCLTGTKYSFKVVDNLIVIVLRDAMVAPQSGIRVKGKVTDEQGAPLPGATVMIKGVKIGGVASDVDGLFEIALPSTEITLIVSFVGMVPVEIHVAKIADLSKLQVIKMKMDQNQMEEVVITGYGKDRKSVV